MILTLLCALAQDVTTDASVARAMRLLAAHGLPAADEVRVYDFINFFKHDLPATAAPNVVGFDARLLRATVPDGAAGMLLQLGFTTARVERDDLQPMNLAIVVDRSGSMSGEKLQYVKQALELFVSNLQERDRLALIVYDDEAEVLMASTAVDNVKTVHALVRSIESGGGTNLHAGLMLGYQEALKGFDPKRANKVILMSDGCANQGVTDLEQIVTDSKAFNAQGIDLTTIGIGLEYDDALMNRLAKEGRGDYHFLHDAGEVNRIFEQEMQGLFERVARGVTVRVRPGPGVTLRAVYGYAFKIDDGIVFELDDMGRALTQILPIELAVEAGADPVVEAVLTYTDLDGKRVEETRTVRATHGADSPTDASVLKHLTIARLATALREACRLAHDGQPTMAEDLLSVALDRVAAHYGDEATKDADIARVLDMTVEAHGLLRATRIE